MPNIVFGSKQHENLYSFLKEINPGHIIYTEFSCKLLYDKFMPEPDPHLYHRIKALRLDVFDYTMKAAFEIQGQQHYEYNSFFHGKITKFQNQIENDINKNNLCDSCGVKLICVSYNEKLTKEMVMAFYTS